MGKPKITTADRARLVDLYKTGQTTLAVALAKELGVTRYYGTILAKRAKAEKSNARLENRRD